MNAKNLVLIDMGMFCAGMYIKAPIYYLYKGNYVLFCKDVLLSDKILKKMYTASVSTDGVFIPSDSYEEIWDESLRQHSVMSVKYEQAYENVRQDYSKVLTKTVGLLGDATPETGISLPFVDDISHDIANEIQGTDQSIMLRCVNMINAVDQYLYTHCVNVATLNGLIGRWLNLSNEDITLLIQCGLVHDVGKLKIDSQILNKKGKLTAEEFDEIKKHPVFSHEILLQSGETNPVILNAVLQHHEKPNGTGYPKGLDLNKISLFARITSVSDVYDAMVSKRCYKEASTPFQVLEQFKTNRFSGLDLEIVNVFLANVTFLFIGMKVMLSNGECAEVVFVPSNDYANPVVKVGDRIFSTTPDCSCVSADISY